MSGGEGAREGSVKGEGVGGWVMLERIGMRRDGVTNDMKREREIRELGGG